MNLFSCNREVIVLYNMLIVFFFNFSKVALEFKAIYSIVMRKYTYSVHCFLWDHRFGGDTARYLEYTYSCV